jgi:hypothetical protein
VNIRVELPHVVYLNQKQRLAESDVRIVSARWFRQQQKVVVEVENSSPRLGRAQEVEETAAGAAAVRGAPFPAVPGRRRRATLPWTAAQPPERLEIKFEGFRLETTAILVDDTPAYEWPAAPDPTRTPPPLQLDRVADVTADDAGEALLRLLARPTIASKAWVHDQYDSMVGAATVVRPGSDAAIVQRLERAELPNLYAQLARGPGFVGTRYAEMVDRFERIARREGAQYLAEAPANLEPTLAAWRQAATK